jgi:hypothetical protein
LIKSVKQAPEPDMVNEKMAEWLDKTLPSLHPMKGIRAAL